MRVPVEISLGIEDNNLLKWENVEIFVFFIIFSKSKYSSIVESKEPL